MIFSIRFSNTVGPSPTGCVIVSALSKRLIRSMPVLGLRFEALRVKNIDMQRVNFYTRKSDPIGFGSGTALPTASTTAVGPVRLGQREAGQMAAIWHPIV